MTRPEQTLHAANLAFEHPRVIDLVARGAMLNPDGTALVHLNTPDDAGTAPIAHDRLMGLLSAAAGRFRVLAQNENDGAGDNGPVVAILVPSCPSLVVALWAAMWAGVAMPLNLLFSREAIAAQLAASGARLLIVPPAGAPAGLYEKVAGLDAEIPGLRIVTATVDGTVAFDGEMLEPDPDWRSRLTESRASADPDRVAALYPTGGTTGAPKLARLTERNMVASAIGSMLSIDYRADDRMLAGLPLFHVGGAFVGCLASLAAGAAMIIPTLAGFRHPAVVAGFWSIVERHRITIGALVPTSLGAVAAVPTGGADLSSLRFVGTGASTCPPEVLKRFLAAWGGDAVRQVYGMTEFAGAIAQVHHDVTPDGAAVGLPLAQADVAILTDDGKLHQGPSTPTGELLVRGPQVFAGYVDARQTAGAFHDGWLRTGDICRIGETGQLHIAGRIKDLIIRGGHSIDPMALEDAAMAHPGVALAAAVGLPDAYAGEVPMLFVVPTAGASADLADLPAFIDARIFEAPARPRRIEQIDDMPLTPVGKIFKPRLRELAAEHAARAIIATAAPDAGATVQAVTDGTRGLHLRLDLPPGIDADSADRIRAALGELPLAVVG
ncbi:AMP-binding protein [Tistrella sp. BH-R2-4]|uniref:AMP-binding protein n=1 Tax=Tistrella arctica TaxID=3133430 RepID=A0ABU9YND2_9PROT